MVAISAEIRFSIFSKKLKRQLSQFSIVLIEAYFLDMNILLPQTVFTYWTALELNSLIWIKYGRLVLYTFLVLSINLWFYGFIVRPIIFISIIVINMWTFSSLKQFTPQNKALYQWFTATFLTIDSPIIILTSE